MNSLRIRLPIGIASFCSPSSSERKRKVKSKERDSAMVDVIGIMRAERETEIVKDKESLDTRMKRRSKVVDASKKNSPNRAVVINNKRRGKKFL